MPVTCRNYQPETDYLRVRQFLIDTFALYGRPFNWTIDRWNFCRYFVTPLHTYYGRRLFSVPTRPFSPVRNETAAWEANIAVWENDAGEIVAVVHAENEEPGEVWTQMHPDYTHLYEEMVIWGEAHLADVVDGLGFVKIYVNEGSALEQVAQRRGYRRLPQRSMRREYQLPADIQPVVLPEGFSLRTVADENDPAKRGRTHALAFGNGYAPSDWVPAWCYEELAKAPDYRPENDLLIVAPNGDYAAFTTMWLDQANRNGMFEPVGTHPDYQRRGLGTLLLQEGFRRMAQQSIERSFMDSSNLFYQKLGFRETPYAYTPWIRYLGAGQAGP